MSIWNCIQTAPAIDDSCRLLVYLGAFIHSSRQTVQKPYISNGYKGNPYKNIFVHRYIEEITIESGNFSNAAAFYRFRKIRYRPWFAWFNSFNLNLFWKRHWVYMPDHSWKFLIIGIYDFRVKGFYMDTLLSSFLLLIYPTILNLYNIV